MWSLVMVLGYQRKYDARSHEQPGVTAEKGKPAEIVEVL